MAVTISEADMDLSQCFKGSIRDQYRNYNNLCAKKCGDERKI